MNNSNNHDNNDDNNDDNITFFQFYFMLPLVALSTVHYSVNIIDDIQYEMINELIECDNINE